MRKFTIQSKKGKTVIMEVECKVITPMEDPSVLWALKPGEYRARILAPECFHQRVETDVNGKKEFVLVPDVWCWHALYDDKGQALAAANKLIEQEFEFNKRKYDKEYTDADLAAAFLAIEVVML
jgi:hypothetical protein